MDKKRQVKSKKRVDDRGEVFTDEQEVNAMLDLVKSETERIDSRFLEPACGDGNFLAEILKRKMAVVKKKYKKYPTDYEKYAVLAISCIYGVDIMQDNVEDCRKRLFDIWDKEYTFNCKKEANDECRDAVKYILSKNIICGNALSLKKVDENGNDTNEPIVFSEWSFVYGLNMQRKDYRFDRLLEKQEMEEKSKKNIEENVQMELFNDLHAISDEGELLKQYVSYYRRVQENE